VTSQEILSPNPWSPNGQSPVVAVKFVIRMITTAAIALVRETVVVRPVIVVSVSIRIIIVLVGRIPRTACQSDKEQNHRPY
jgi:hypothetical protein